MMSVIKILRAIFGILILVAGIASCTPDLNNLPPEVRAEIERIRARSEAMTGEHRTLFRSLYRNREGLKSFLSNTTVRTYDGIHGSQFELLTTDGRTFLWYPGNLRPVRGQWDVKQSSDGPDMCFLYGSNTYNPYTKESGGRWECEDASLYLLGTYEIVDGDPLNLASGRVPFDLDKGSSTINDALRRMGRPPVRTNKVNW